MLAGVKKQYDRMGRKVTALALAGDGGSSDAGFQSLSGAAERNDPILFICVDNEGYMNTGMQSSGVTPYGSWTTTTPVGGEMHGKRTEAKNLPLIMTMHNCSYVATASTAFLEDYYAKLEKALAVAETGMAYLHSLARRWVSLVRGVSLSPEQLAYHFRRAGRRHHRSFETCRLKSG
jgi:phenylglyoxylate dehydrogenase beta subunit